MCLFFLFVRSAFENGENAGPFSDGELFEAADSIRAAVERKLRSKSVHPEPAPCRRDILYFWFSNWKVQDGASVELRAENFPVKFFPPGWDMLMNVHGKGQRVNYPMTINPTSRRRTPKKYMRTQSGAMMEADCAMRPHVLVQFVGVQSHV